MSSLIVVEGVRVISDFPVSTVFTAICVVTAPLEIEYNFIIEPDSKFEEEIEGVESLVRLSVALSPVSEELIKSGASGFEGATLSITNARTALVA